LIGIFVIIFSFKTLKTLNPKKKAFVNVGCYGPYSGCDDAFVGQKLSSIQCSIPLPDFTCNIACFLVATYSFESITGMTVEKCLQICTSKNYKYAEITSE
jgi:hypothetical protein